MSLFLFHKHFIFFTIFLSVQTVSLIDASEVEKRCDKREQLQDEKENDPISNIKVHKNYIVALLKRMKLDAENIELDIDEIQKEIDESLAKTTSNVDSYNQNYDKLSPVDKIVPRLHGFLMVTPDKSVAAPVVENEERNDGPPNIYELLNILMHKIHESCNQHQVSSDEKLLSILTRLKRYLKSSKEVQHETHWQ